MKLTPYLSLKNMNDVLFQRAAVVKTARRVEVEYYETEDYMVLNPGAH